MAKVLIILATGEKEKALTGLLYATNAVRREWLEDVKICFFGPFESLLAEDSEVQEWVARLGPDHTPMACKYLSDKAGVSEKLSLLGVDVQYVGEFVSRQLQDGYVPMVW